MYTLYYKPYACSLATHTILNLLDIPVEAIDKNKVDNFTDINPVGIVPVLKDGNKIVREGVAVILYLLDKHPNQLIAPRGDAREQAIENMLFANATMHPAYGRLFFLSGAINDETVKQEALNAAAVAINQLWDVVEQCLGSKPFLGGDVVSPADILLTVYSRWGQFFPVDIVIGEKTASMMQRVMEMAAFRDALEQQETA
ncbi:MAG: glutathione S-transferase N-terminal domain-containing protein [Pseudomonadales bacterium]|nr:glutathione S-transferase N-terminal domain-containing protein [Pseudomonadales bacterium]